MSILKYTIVFLCVPLMGASFITPAFGQEATPGANAGGKPSEAEMMAKMMEMAQPGEHHQVLAKLVGKWDYKVKFAGAPGAELAEAGHGTAVRKSEMGGRYFVLNVAGKIMMPGADGKMASSEFEGMSIEGYDNVKQKFFSTWIDNMGTSFILSEGTYDPAAKTFTYLFDMEPAPGMKMKARQVVKLVDPDHVEMDWYEGQGAKEVKTMEIDYARQK